MTDHASTPRNVPADPGWEAIARHFAGESPSDESAAVRAWLAANPRDARALDALAAASDRLGARGRAGVDVEGALARVHERMYQPNASGVPAEVVASGHARFRRRFWTARGLAAAAAIIIVAGLYATRERRDAPAPAAPRIVATGTGEIDSVTLGDGSRIVLGAGSRLVVPASYDRERAVILQGQAAFTVRHDATRPFTVRVGGVTVTDVGTTFGVREDEGAGVVVAVTEGSVRVSTATDAGVVLNTGRAATVTMDGRVRTRAEAATPADLAWTTGELVFRDAPMARVQSDLRRWYGVVLLVPQPELAQRRLTATFRRDSRDQVLTVLSLSLGATYEVRGDTAVLRSRAAP